MKQNIVGVLCAAATAGGGALPAPAAAAMAADDGMEGYTLEN